MKLNRISALLVGTLFLVGAMAGARADILQIDGEHVRFFYDSDLWGTNSATVNGDTISFAISPTYSLEGQVTQSGFSYFDNRFGKSDSALTVVAKTGYEVKFGVTTQMTGSYRALGNDSNVSVSGVGLIGGGTYAGGSYHPFGEGEQYGVSSQFGSGQQGSMVALDTFVAASGRSYQALRAGVRLSTGIVVNEVGESAIDFDAYRYQFNVIAVPEPGQYGMMAVGLSMLALLARRRQSKHRKDLGN